jgi:SNF2 family DNA or RNA helicase
MTQNLISNSSNNSNNLKKFEKKIKKCLEKFTEYLNYSKMDHKDYQRAGVEWCLKNELRQDPIVNIRGGFIADEMGLGKTIIMIGLMISNFKIKTLVVLPPILIDTWYTQILKTTGHKALIYHGENKKKITAEQLNSACVVISSYGGITVTKKQLKQQKLTPIHDIKWSRIIFDEAHHMRNKKTIVYLSAKLLKSEIRWLVSGTPIQNKKTDFYNLCSILGMPANFYKDSENMETISSNFILKRTKKQVGIQLPEISSFNNLVKWQNKKEMELSEEIHSSLSFSRVIRSRKKSQDEEDDDDDDDDEINIDKISNNNSDVILMLMMRARQSCILPQMMKKNLRELVRIGVISSYDYYKEALNYSSKINYVIQNILSRKDNQRGKLIFCHYRDEIDEIARRLKDGGMTKIATLDGRICKSKRNDILNEKNNALILQIQTGCEGLNLQENYSEIYFVSPCWNPAVEDQAIARCHRIGQKNPVTVFKFQMSNFNKDENENEEATTQTIDEYVNSVQELKREISNSILSN